MPRERKCVGCKFGINRGSKYIPDWGCRLPTGENAEVCKFNKSRVKNFFTPREVKK